MATRRKRTKATGRARAAGRHGGGRATGARTRRRATGSRQAPGAAAARELRAQQEGERTAGKAPARAPSRGAAGEAAAGTSPGDGPLRATELPPGEADARGLRARDAGAAELARRIEATVGAAADTLRTGPESAAEALGVHRDQVEDAARQREAARDLPGATQLALELAVGAFRLARAVAAAPFRIGLAFLRRGDASA